MMSWRSLAIAAACTTVALPALAGQPNPATGQPGLPGPIPQKSVGASGPMAGAGLPFLLMAGAYFLVRRHRNRSKVEYAVRRP